MKPIRRLLPFSWISVLALALSLSTAQAQPEDAPVSEEFSGETTVTVVEVPVQVLVDGEPVRGLTAEDFVIYDGEERREVRFFETVDFHQEAIGRDDVRAREEVPAAGRRHFLLFFDLDFTPAHFIARAQEAALRLVEEELDPTDLVGIAFFHGRSGESSVVGFTSDRGEVVEALEGLGRLVGDDGEGDEGEAPETARAGSGFGGDRLGLTYGGWNVHAAEIGRFVDKERGLADETLDWYPGGGGGGKAPDGVSETLADMAAYSEQDVQQRRAARASALVEALKNIARQTRFIDGSKHMLLFSQGFESTLYTQEGHSWLYSELETAVEELRRAGWAVHGIDTGEVWATWRRRQKRESLALLADATGGELYKFAADPARAVERVVERTSVTYVLGFQTGEIPMDGSFRELRVELVPRPDGAPEGARVTHRTGYFTPRSPTARDGETWRAEAGELILTGDEMDEIGVEAMAAPVRLSGGHARVPVLLEIEGAGLLQDGSVAPRRMELYVYAFSPGGEVEAVRTREVLLDPSRMTSLAGGYKLIETLDLPPGEHQVRVLVRNVDSGQVALRLASVTVPWPGDRATHLLQPVFVQESGEPWVLVSEADEATEEETAEGIRRTERFPFTFRQRRFLPALAPVVKRGESRPVLIMGYGLPVDGRGLRVRVVDVGGRPVEGAGFSLAGREMGGAGTPDVIALDLQPGALPPGTYSVEASVAGLSGWSRGARFRVVAPRPQS